MSVRLKLPPGDVPPAAAARHMGLTREAFDQALPLLIGRGFPAPDPDTGNFDLAAIDEWRRRRHPHLFETKPLPASQSARDAEVLANRLARLRGG